MFRVDQSQSPGGFLIGSPLNFPLLRRSEWICLEYFAYIAVLSFFIKVPQRRRLRLLALNGIVAIGIILLPAALSFTPKLFASVVRDWLPAPLILLGFHEAGRLTIPRSDQFFERAFLRWDQAVFCWPLVRFLDPNRGLPGWFDALLEFSYLQCYVTVPSGIAVLYIAHRGGFADQYWTVVLPAVFVSYGLTPLFPAQPPRKAAEKSLPTRDLSGLRRLNLWILDHASIQVNTFPSGHVAGAVSASLGLMRLLPAAGVCYMLIATGIFLGTVRGRYHYALDAAAAVAVAAAAYLGSLLT